MKKKENKLWKGVRYIWEHPIILAPFLLYLAYLLFNEIRTQAFRHYLNCSYLLGDWLKINALGNVPWPFQGTWTNAFCQGITLGSMKIGLATFLDPSLEFVRTIAIWAVLLFFAFISLLLTLTIKNLETIIKIVRLDKEEWKRFGSSISIFLLFFVIFCTLFYFKVMHPEFLDIRLPGQ